MVQEDGQIPKSYSNATAAPKLSTSSSTPTSSLTSPIPPASFYSTSNKPASRLPPATNYSRPTSRIPVKKDYVEIDTDDVIVNDQERTEEVINLVPNFDDMDQGISVDGNSYSNNTPKASAWKKYASPSISSTRSTLNEVNSTIAAYTPMNQLPTEVTTTIEDSPSLSPSPPLPGVLRSNPSIDLNKSDTTLEFKGPGWITPKIVELSGTAGSPGIAGIYHDSLWDMEIFDTPSEDYITTTDETKGIKYLPMGEWVMKEPPLVKVNEVENGGGSAASELKDDKMDSTNEVLVQIQPILDSSTSNTTSVPLVKKFKTPTREELDTIRPHPNAHFSKKTNSWTIFASHPIPTTFLPDLHVELWRTSLTSLAKASELGIKSPPQPALPDSFPSNILIEDWSATRPTLMRLKSTKGKEVLYSQADYYPAVIPFDLWKEMCEKRSEPTPSKTKIASLFDSIHSLWKSIDSLLFKGQLRSLPIHGRVFGRTLPFDNATRHIFLDVLGFNLEEGDTLKPPNVDERTAEGLINRNRLLRCWLELAIWLESTKKVHPELPQLNTRVSIKPASSAMLSTLGGDHFDRLPTDSGWKTQGKSTATFTENPAAAQYHNLGVVQNISDEELKRVYEAQINLNPDLSHFFLSYIDTIQKIRNSDILEIFRVKERSNGRYSLEDLEKAYDTIGCQKGYSLPDDYLWNSFGVHHGETNDSGKKQILKDAMKLVAENRNSEYLKVMLISLGEEVKPKMDFQKALLTLGIDVTSPPEEFLLNMIFEVRIGDAVLQTEKETMREATGVVAEALGYTKTLQMLGSGTSNSNAGWETPYVSPDRPVGLTNIANTCYLNSLLQYFFTVRELREAILGFEENLLIDDQQDDLRVGGRLVTKREIERSKRFVIHLQMLFNQLIHTPSTSVTPETELAYLALVPSKEEESKEAESKVEIPIPTSSTQQEKMVIDPTLTNIDPALLDGSLDKPKSPSVLGKRGSDHLDTTELTLDGMAIDSSDDGALTSTVGSPSSVVSINDDRSVRRRGTPPSDEILVREAEDGVVEIGLPGDLEMATRSTTPVQDSPPPLPPRPVQSNLEKEVSTYMAFGRQNDVTECADNVLFQIECALSANSPSAIAADVLNRTFYGKMRQRLEIENPIDGEPVRLMEEKFSSLLVDVAEEGRDLYDGLDTVFDDAMVDIEGKQARRSISLVDVPPILQVQLQRVQYDRIEQKIFKSNAHLSFPAVISMDRYLEINPNDLDASARRDRTTTIRKALEDSRRRYKEIKKYKSSDASDTLRKAFNHLSNQPDLLEVITPELAEETINEANSLDEEILNLEILIKFQRDAIDLIWQDEKTAVYELVSVFIHRGTALSGHYYIYQRDNKKPETWLKYNDSQVTDIAAEEVFKTSGDTNAYFLVYCRRDRLDAISSIREVHPEVYAPPAPAPSPALAPLLDDDMMGVDSSKLLTID